MEKGLISKQILGDNSFNPPFLNLRKKKRESQLA